jgi:hypothetical protein
LGLGSGLVPLHGVGHGAERFLEVVVLDATTLPRPPTIGVEPLVVWPLEHLRDERVLLLVVGRAASMRRVDVVEDAVVGEEGACVQELGRVVRGGRAKGTRQRR